MSVSFGRLKNRHFKKCPTNLRTSIRTTCSQSRPRVKLTWIFQRFSGTTSKLYPPPFLPPPPMWQNNFGRGGEFWVNWPFANWHFHRGCGHCCSISPTAGDVFKWFRGTSVSVLSCPTQSPSCSTFLLQALRVLIVFSLYLIINGAVGAPRSSVLISMKLTWMSQDE